MAAKQKYIWLAVSPDEYELPLAIADTAQELSNILGLNVHTIKANATRGHSGTQSGRKIIRVERSENV